MSILEYIQNLYFKLTRGSERSSKLKKNVLLSLFVKAGSIICSLLLVPASMNFVNNDVSNERYGIWLTISSIVAWMSFFDIGFTNGLRNKLAEAFGFKDYKVAKVYISTTYVILSVIFLVLMVVLLLLVRNFDISPLLKINMDYESDLKVALYVLIVYFCVTFILRILSVVLIADQRPAYSSFIDFLGQGLSLVAVLFLPSGSDGSLAVLSYSLCIPPMLVWLVFTLICYGKDYRECIPSLKNIDFKYAGCILSLGLKFFVIQIAALIQFQTANLLIARLISMEEVTQYNIAYKYFNVLYMVFMILLQPFWSAVTEAYSKGDTVWIKSSVKRYVQLAALTFVGGLLMLVASDFVYSIWIGNKVFIPFELSAWMFIYIYTMIFGAIFVYFVNGIGALKIQYVSSLISPLLFIGVVFLLVKVFNIGVISILVASIIANFNGLILAPMQYYKVIIKKNKGIWTT